MKDAKTLLIEFLAAVTGSQNAAALFAEDGAVELPFLHSLGIPWRHRGRQAISELQGSLSVLYLDFAFKPEDTHVLIDTPEQSPRTEAVESSSASLKSREHSKAQSWMSSSVGRPVRFASLRNCHIDTRAGMLSVNP